MKLILRKFEPRRSNLRASALLALIAAGLVCGTTLARAATRLNQGLSAYDAAIQADPNPALAKLTTPVTLDGTAGAPFDFGATFGDTTIEFILQGDPTAGADSYLAVGSDPSSSLRYAQYANTDQLGFTQAGEADYTFTPAVASPVNPTHIAYVWDSVLVTMSVYVNGTLAGTNASVSFNFNMPSGPGFLGSNPGGTEAMTGTIYRVTVYPSMLSDTEIKSHADAFANAALPIINSFTATPGEIQPQASSVLSWQVQNTDTVYLNGVVMTGTNLTVSPPVTTTYTLIASNEVSTATAKVRLLVDPQLDVYDAAIAADTAAGLTPLATLTNTMSLDGTGGQPFDFGANSGDVTMEFILEGDPTAGQDGYLAVGENTTSNLRYAQWQNTDQMGFTQLGVADYLFVPSVASPTIATHVAYVWNAENYSMQLYVNGVASGTVTNVSTDFAMPTGAGFLGANPTGGEAMTGRIFRVVVYGEDVPEATIQKHANAFTSVLHPPIIDSFTATPTEILGQGSSVLKWQVENATAVLLNGVNVTGVTNQTVSPAFSTSYTLVASNNVSAVSATVRVLVTPSLTGYDAAIAADTAGGLTPLATLTNIVSLSGGGGEPFDFGPTFGDTTMEFILEGDPTVGADAYLAVGENSTSNLRYAGWPNTEQMGFTQLGVADYLFTPAVPSPTIPTHVAYVWDSANFAMTIYTNGIMAGTSTNVDANFAMPSGAGFLGANPTGGEAMTGRIFRVVVYSGMVPEATIQKHANAFSVASQHPSLSIAITGGQPAITLQGVAGAHYQVQYRDSFSAADTWQLLQDIPSLSGGSIQVVDPTAIAGRSQRFYQAVTVP
jgi:Concanavalin A-like lectin/glucanases superfamily